ncbi:uncharacterized protein LOC126313306 [Schistocerca gregaria]|uniref:uncharacterized protein LOC126313306 n=1 Tax=Schistocerca gregaria TaxID=7010 RepID=UPI00211DC415|nr:uncharacterized protein LOC126313306 [Schistocerca gregaria]
MYQSIKPLFFFCLVAAILSLSSVSALNIKLAQLRFFLDMYRDYQGFRDFTRGIDPRLYYCNIDGVVCDEEGRLTELAIVNYNINGEIKNTFNQFIYLKKLIIDNCSVTMDPIFIKFFPDLTILSLSNNRITGDIPDLTAPLSKIDLSGNYFTTLPRAISKLATYVNFGDNQFDQDLTTGKPLCDAPLTKVLKLHGNKFHGNPTNIFLCLPELVELDISRNNFTGNITKGVLNLNKLVKFNISHNQFSEHIPYFKVNKQLVEIDISGNKFEGIYNYDRFGFDHKFINMSHNKFQGRIPIFFSKMKKLEVLDLSDNMFQGNIPAFSSQVLIKLNLSYNILNGPMPSFNETTPSLKYLDLSYNRLAIVCDDLIFEETKIGVGDSTCDVSNNLFFNKCTFDNCTISNYGCERCYPTMVGKRPEVSASPDSYKFAFLILNIFGVLILFQNVNSLLAVYQSD